MNDLIIIKLGGNAATQLTPAFFTQLKAWHAAGQHLLLIHGGGPQINAWSAKMGLHAHKLAGIRVTDPATLAVTQAVLLGLVQPTLCQAIAQAGLPVIGLNTTDEQLLVGEYLDQHQYGEVGQVTAVNAAYLHDMLRHHVGVLAPLAQTTQGQMLNVNADMAAASIAQALHPAKLILLTDVPGVLRDGAVMPSVTTGELAELIRAEVITSGMQPKVNAAATGAQSGASVVITDDLTHPGTEIRIAG
ncbi:acetylglutamate kinase [Lacticaseibacillus absianus]|uniref:acetylglutamate kinase n=1 Tax=Lacticaseibacillus absianus TaxID=2729623 RepID=UPI0015CBBC69|nr:acetylglutamate kinase [Lacticaseibacillus absianus]